MTRKIYFITLAITLLLSINVFSQTVTYQLSTGSIDTGRVVTISTFGDAPIIEDQPFETGYRNTDFYSEPMILDPQGAPVYESMYFEDSFGSENLTDVGDDALLLRKYNISLPNNVAPPDPTIAVGPNHVIVLTNNATGIFIYDKQGNLLRSLNTTQWWSPVWPSQDGDPQIIYDHFENRWVMVFMQIDDVAQTAGNLIAYSENENPIGTWYMYRLNTRTHGTTPSNTWGDYPQLGFDDKALYIMTRCFPFAGGNPLYTKIRIIPKAQFYSSNAGPFSYTDIWDITQPGTSTRPDVIHPSFHYSVSNDHYLLFASRGGGNVYSFYKLSDPIGNPILTGTNIFVTPYGLAPDAIQPPDLTTPRIASNGSHIKTAPVYRDGYLYATHSIRNSQYPAYSSVKYIKINVNTNAIEENYELGQNRTAYIYPAIAVDKDRNVMITCTRSGDSEFAGSYYLGRRANDPPGLSNAYTLQPGLATYVCTFCVDRNRWGDYLGVYLDPAGEYDFWMVSQYASALNTYAVSVGNVRLKPYDGPYIFSRTASLNFSNVEVGEVSEILEITLANFGDADVIISDIPDSSADFFRVSEHTFPITLVPHDSVSVQFQFRPTVFGEVDYIYPVINNSSNFTGVNLKGKGFVINPAELNKFYAISGQANNGNLLTIDQVTGAGTNIGPSLFNNLIDIAVNPKDNVIYGLRTSATNSELVRINGTEGDGYKYLDIGLNNLYSMAFDSSGQLYVISNSGQISSVDLSNGNTAAVSQLPIINVSITFNQLNNELWGSHRVIGTPRDRILKINLATGDTTIVGQTGFNVNTVGLAFNELGELFGIKGTASVANDFFSIDQTSGTGTLVGSVGISDLKGLAFSFTSTTSVEDDLALVPKEFALSQNYPNPFNPYTTINFSLPVTSNVKLTVYNILGEVVNVLFDKEFQSGNYNVIWNADDQFGRKVSSGVYFYELRASSDNGNEFNQFRKMVLLK